MNEVEEFGTLLSTMDFNKMEFHDQLAVMVALSKFMEKTKPILLKYAAQDEKVTNFLFKL